MKKLLWVFLALLATVCLLSMTVSAANTGILSDDLQTLTIGDNTYSQADLSAMDLYFQSSYDHIQPPAGMEDQIKNISVYSTKNDWVKSVEIYYTNGSKMELCFVEDSVLPELLEICQGDDVVCYIDFWWESRPSVNLSIAQFKDAPTTLTSSEVGWSNYYEVLYRHEKLDAYVYRGFLCEYRSEYYYVDYQENNIYDPITFSSSRGPDLYKAYQITDPELCQQIHDAMESEISGTTDLGQSLSAAFLSFIFAFIPLVILIPSVIITIRSKGYYRITWGITGGLCIAELIIFAIVSVLLA